MKLVAGRRARYKKPSRLRAGAGSLRAPGWFVCEQLEHRRLLTVGLDGLSPVDTGPVAFPLFETIASSADEVEPLASSAAPTGFVPDEIRHAYAYDEIFFEGGSIVGDGAGQTIAIVNAYHTPTALNDLTEFSNYFGLPMPPSFTQVDQIGGTSWTSSNSSWARETALDIQWAHALAPGANILLVEANTATFGDLGTAVDYARSQPGVSAISMSWGGGEYATQTSFDPHFATPSEHTNLTFFAAAGNTGAPGLYPAYSPNVMASGGTSLALDGQDNWLAESSWNGSGGGISQYEAQPSWQTGVVTQSSTMRTMPDVAFDGDPNSGVSIYDTYNNSPSTPWTKLAGTSFTAPSWAALVTIANQGRSLVGLPTLDIPELMTAIYAMPQSNFHDITSNGGAPANPPAPGYDLVTGRGTPIGDLIVEYLVGLGSVSGTVFDDVNGNAVQDGELGLAGWTVYADLDADGGFDPLAVNNFASVDLPKNIGAVSANTVTSSFSVSGLSGQVVDANVTVNIAHARLSDLELTLVAPDGTRVTLAAGEGQAGDNYAGTTFDDSAPVSITVGTGQFSGSYHPSGSLLDLFAKNSNGTWQLEVKDTVFLQGGTFNSWSLQLTTGDPSNVSAADGSYYIDVLPAGTYDIRQVDQSPYTQTGPVGGFYSVNLAFAGHSTGQDFGNQAPASTAPSGVTLLAASDTGASSSDQITNLNNSSPGAALQFDVSGTIAGATVMLYADGVPIGSAVASGAATTVTTDGTTTLADGGRSITARQFESGSSESGDSPSLAVQIDTQAPQATLVPVSPDPRTTPVAQMTILFDEQVTGLELGDLSLTRDGGANLLSGTQSVASGDGITWMLGDLTALTGTPGVYELIMSPAGAPIADVAGNVNSSVENTTFTVESASSPAPIGRFLLYNNSFFDGGDTAINASDDAAIDTSKSAYIPDTGPATDANISGYDKGINGIAVDLLGAGIHTSITASDFVFITGNNNSPGSWATAPAPSAVSVRTGAGVSGSDRVEITWADGAIANAWLGVKVLANGNTGLSADDYFFFGNAVGDGGVGNTATTAPVNATDEIAARNNPHNFLNPAPVDYPFDYNKDHFVDASDQIVSRNNGTNILDQLMKIDISSGVPFAPGGGETVAPATTEPTVQMVGKVLADAGVLPSAAVNEPLLPAMQHERSMAVSAPSRPSARVPLFSLQPPRDILAGHVATTRIASSLAANHDNLFAHSARRDDTSAAHNRQAVALAASSEPSADEHSADSLESVDEDLLDLLAADLHFAAWQRR